MRRRDPTAALRRKDHESGQAMVEFALILIPLLILVVGIIQFGIGLNYWLDMKRIANQGARWAAVNNWPPDCPVGTDDPPGCPSPNTLQETLHSADPHCRSEGSTTIEICYPNGGGPRTRVNQSRFTSRLFEFLPILGIGTITLSR